MFSFLIEIFNFYMVISGAHNCGYLSQDLGKYMFKINLNA